MLQQGKHQEKIPDSKRFNECLIKSTVDSDKGPDYQCSALATRRLPSVGYCPFFLNKSAVVTGNKGGARPFPPCERSMHLRTCWDMSNPCWTSSAQSHQDIMSDAVLSCLAGRHMVSEKIFKVCHGCQSDLGILEFKWMEREDHNGV